MALERTSAFLFLFIKGEYSSLIPSVFIGGDFFAVFLVLRMSFGLIRAMA